MNDDFYKQLNDLVNRINVLERYAGNKSKVPAGTINMFGGSSAPTGWLICNGNAVSRTTYSGLFSIIGTTYGTGDGSTTFNLPNLKGKVVVGLDSGDTSFDALGETGGAKTHTLSTAEMPTHNHGAGSLAAPIYTTVGGTVTVPNIYTPLTSNYTELANELHYGLNTTCVGSTANAGSGSAHNNLQPYITLNYIIKT